MSALLLLTLVSFCLKSCHAYLPSKLACLLLASITTPVQLYLPSTTALVLHSPWFADSLGLFAGARLALGADPGLALASCAHLAFAADARCWC
ncbi:hypothetical protein PF010_g12461 [Phytophthora fragariae]|uniref:Secreted protein n=1 Tax=Phytophthora fragariae TaxID=53985 RepID=A0A6A3TXR5_9STRA|nr:hypothetical protein PF010_g12461 [Phytophthora fragariae]KAE9107112.1 hypothetical protein PF007_g13156 [Phytophthora fragariae]KAE9142084.1 hypothetical protein PF006_g12786 [Phytophthora fragariae]KAE9216070.1 hypothetical protein PF004_g14556 [Phytophthora fragariae]KAE9223310.1 hypothetical protein PF002_g15010 [Phytophthora fragariae]